MRNRPTAYDRRAPVEPAASRVRSTTWPPLAVLPSAVFLAIAATAVAAPPSDSTASENGERRRLLSILEEGVRLPESWAAVHAAESLIALERPQPVLDAFRGQADTAVAGYRIGVWRVLAQAEPSDDARRRYAQRIRDVLLDRHAPDRVHAMEALAKLNVPSENDDERRRVKAASEDPAEPSAPFALWRRAQAGERPFAIERLTSLLQSKNAVIRLRAGYVLGRMRPLPEPAQSALIDAAEAEPEDSIARPFLACATGLEAAEKLVRTTDSSPVRYAAAMEFATLGSIEDRPLLRPLLDDADADVRIAAAFALLKIAERAAAAN